MGSVYARRAPKPIKVKKTNLAENIFRLNRTIAGLTIASIVRGKPKKA